MAIKPIKPTETVYVLLMQDGLYWVKGCTTPNDHSRVTIRSTDLHSATFLPQEDAWHKKYMLEDAGHKAEIVPVLLTTEQGRVLWEKRTEDRFYLVTVMSHCYGDNKIDINTYKYHGDNPYLAVLEYNSIPNHTIFRSRHIMNLEEIDEKVFLSLFDIVPNLK